MSENKPNTFPEQSQNQPGREHKMKPMPEVIRDGYRGSGKLDGQNVLITGGDSGIGRAVAVHFAREGANVAISYLSEDTDAEETKRLVEDEGQSCFLYPGDLRDKDYVTGLLESVQKDLGSLEVLVNNAAQQFPEDSLLDISDEHLAKTFDINILSMIRLTREALRVFSEIRSIVNSTSVTSYRGSSHLIDYASTKGAITAFTRSLAKSLASKGVRVNGVAPGPIWTPLIPATFDDVSDFGSDTPLERAGQPSEVAPAYVYLACEDSSYTTGQVIHVNGGEVVGG